MLILYNLNTNGKKINDDSLLNDPKKREFFAQLHACVKID